ncbi:MAG: cation transporter [Endomicrobiales bacterium]|nr:cation transporter [Endomicrobiales bacterium]
MRKEQKLLLILGFNVFLMCVEVAGGIISGSLALLSDAGHMFADSVALMLSYVAVIMAKRPSTSRKTFGWHRTEIIVALVNGIALLLIAGYIFYEAVMRFFHPQEIKTGVLLVVAVIGLLGNVLGMLLLRSESHSNLNIRSAFFHIMGDAMSSVGVVIGGVIIAYTGWNIVDSVIGVLIGGIVLRGAFNLIVESGNILLEAAPEGIDINDIKSEVERIPGVKEFHGIHVWAITSGSNALSAHAVTGNITTRESQQLLCRIREVLDAKFNIRHATIETECDACQNASCEFSNTNGDEHGV